jgi:flavin-dependent dehydrogenase
MRLHSLLILGMYDLIVVGAGPAGVAAARSAAQRGLSTLLVEKEKIPRNKLCGEGVTPKLPTLLDFRLPGDLIERTLRSARLHVGDNCYTFETDRALMHMTSRASFDKFLSDKAVEAGAELRSACPVRGVHVTDSHAEIQTPTEPFRSRMLIGADGAAGPVAAAAQLRSHWSPDQVLDAIQSEALVGETAVQDFAEFRILRFFLRCLSRWLWMDLSQGRSSDCRRRVQVKQTERRSRIVREFREANSHTR